jgi:hypothetical protein
MLLQIFLAVTQNTLTGQSSKLPVNVLGTISQRWCAANLKSFEDGDIQGAVTLAAIEENRAPFFETPVEALRFLGTHKIPQCHI